MNPSWDSLRVDYPDLILDYNHKNFSGSTRISMSPLYLTVHLTPFNENRVEHQMNLISEIL